MQRQIRRPAKGSHARPTGKNSKSGAHGTGNLTTDLLKSLLCTLATGLTLLLTVSLVAYFTPDPGQWIPVLGLTASGLTALLGGYAAARIHGSGALICGLGNGGMVMAVMLLLSLFFTKDASGYGVWISALLHGGFLLLSVLGAYLGIPGEKSKRRKKRG
ncbi:MAG: TIGR04086 family membrane protein [Clostridia bacterium]|nr:TIGR04086 family membrane protein [Clostridia bacterium]